VVTRELTPNAAFDYERERQGLSYKAIADRARAYGLTEGISHGRLVALLSGRNGRYQRLDQSAIGTLLFVLGLDFEDVGLRPEDNTYADAALTDLRRRHPGVFREQGRSTTHCRSESAGRRPALVLAGV
jgi:hypothetical protein